MQPTTESEVLVLHVFLATVPASLIADRGPRTRNTDIATSYESNCDLSNQLRRVRFLKEGEKIKRFMYLLMSEILLCVIILVQLLHVALIQQPKLTFSENAILGCIHWRSHLNLWHIKADISNIVEVHLVFDDIMTLILVTIPLYLLYEVSIRVVAWSAHQ